MKTITLLALNLCACLSFAATHSGGISLSGNCSVESANSQQTFEVESHSSQKLILGYIGEDNGRYKISIVNNGQSVFEILHGAVQVGFSRDDLSIRNPPVLCPSFPEDLKRECEEQNNKHNPPFVPAPTDGFQEVSNDNGQADADIGPAFEKGHVDPNHFTVYKTVVTSDKILNSGDSFSFQTPVIGMGNVKATCSLVALRK